MAEWSSCEQYEDGQRVNGGRECKKRKKKKRHIRRAGVTIGICRERAESRKQMRPEEKKRMLQKRRKRREMKGSVFILVQVSLFIKVIILRRCKTLLCCVKNVNYPAEDGVVFTFMFLADQLDVP